jgi:hypothetical protein
LINIYIYNRVLTQDLHKDVIMKEPHEGVFISLSILSISQRKIIESLSSITPAVKNFLLALIDIANTNKTNDQDFFVVPRSSLQKYLLNKGSGASDSLVSRRLSALTDLGVCTVERSIGNSRKINRYTITDLSILFNLPQVPSKKNVEGGMVRTNKAVVKLQREVFSSGKSGLLLDNPEDVIFFNERLFNGILDTCTRVSSKDPRKTIEVTYKVAGYPLKITSSCTTKSSSQLLLMTDQRAMRSIVSYCKKKVIFQKKKLADLYGESFDLRKLPNLFVVDIHDLCRLMNLPAVTNNLDIVVGMMDRLSDTVFEVDSTENPWFRENFSLAHDRMQSNIFKIRFLNDFEIATESVSDNQRNMELFKKDTSLLRPRYYTFSLETRLFHSMIQENQTNMFLSHKGLSSERSGIIQRFYNWARAVIGGWKKTGIEEKWFTSAELHERLTPNLRYDNFKIYFMRAIVKFSVDDNWTKKVGGRALIYGYYVDYKREGSLDLFRISRDPTDELVGLNSTHNILIRRTQEALSHAGS